MNASNFLKKYGWADAEQVAIKAGTNRAYFSHLAYGHSRPSTDLALRLVKASGNRMSFEKLLLVPSQVAVKAAKRKAREATAQI